MLMLWQREDAWLRIVMDDETLAATGEAAMTKETRAATQALVDELDAKLTALNVVERRMPKVQTLAGPKSFAYVAYRFDSQIGTHPSMKAAEQLLSRESDGSLQLHRDPPAGDLGQPDTYGVCAISLARILTMIEEIRQDPMTPMVDSTALNEVVATLVGE